MLSNDTKAFSTRTIAESVLHREYWLAQHRKAHYILNNLPNTENLSDDMKAALNDSIQTYELLLQHASIGGKLHTDLKNVYLNLAIAYDRMRGVVLLSGKQQQGSTNINSRETSLLWERMTKRILFCFEQYLSVASPTDDPDYRQVQANFENFKTHYLSPPVQLDDKM